jgi:hypothetical protein
MRAGARDVQPYGEGRAPGGAHAIGKGAREARKRLEHIVGHVAVGDEALAAGTVALGVS